VVTGQTNEHTDQTDCVLQQMVDQYTATLYTCVGIGTGHWYC